MQVFALVISTSDGCTWSAEDTVKVFKHEDTAGWLAIEINKATKDPCTHAYVRSMEIHEGYSMEGVEPILAEILKDLEP